MVNSYKLYTNDQRMKVYMLIIYIIHVECDDIMLSHHLRLNVACDFHLCNEWNFSYTCWL
jgi:hypothetical protein